MSPPTVAIILAAGRGTRLGPLLTGDGPKPLVEVGGRTLFEHQVAAFAAAGVEHVVAVVGHAAPRMVAAAEPIARRHRVRVSFVPNEAYRDTNTVVSQYLARRWLERGAWCANGDVLFGANLVRRLAAAPGGTALAIDAKPCGDEEVKVVVERGSITEIGKTIDPSRCLGEFVGLARYDADAGAAFSDALEVAVERERRRLDYFEIALHTIAPAVHLLPVLTGPDPVIEIDTPDDYFRALREVAPRLLGAAISREVA